MKIRESSKGNKRILMVRSNPVNPDSKLEKEAMVLSNAGFIVKILCWNRDLSGAKDENKENYFIHRINIKAPTGMKIVIFWPIWWFNVVLMLLKEDYDILHAVDFDSYFPSLIIAKIRKKTIIYDIFDCYPEVTKLPKIIYFLFKGLDLKLMNLADKIIIVDECRLKQINMLDKPEKVHVIYNSPQNISTIKLNNSCKSNKYALKIFYGGGFSTERDNYSMISVVKKHPDISLLLAGMGQKEIVENIEKMIEYSNNIQFIGKIPYERVLTYSMQSDLLYSFYDPEILNNQFASPNKLFESMMCGLPLITNDGIATANKVREECCGIVVPYKDEYALEKAVLYLRDNPDERVKMGINGKKAYDQKYSWKKMETELLNVYKCISMN